MSEKNNKKKKKKSSFSVSNLFLFLFYAPSFRTAWADSTKRKVEREMQLLPLSPRQSTINLLSLSPSCLPASSSFFKIHRETMKTAKAPKFIQLTWDEIYISLSLYFHFYFILHLSRCTTLSDAMQGEIDFLVIWRIHRSIRSGSKAKQIKNSASGQRHRCSGDYLSREPVTFERGSTSEMRCRRSIIYFPCYSFLVPYCVSLFYFAIRPHIILPVFFFSLLCLSLSSLAQPAGLMARRHCLALWVHLLLFTLVTCLFVPVTFSPVTQWSLPLPVRIFIESVCSSLL